MWGAEVLVVIVVAVLIPVAVVIVPVTFIFVETFSAVLVRIISAVTVL